MSKVVLERALELGYNSIQALILSKRLEDAKEVDDFLASSKNQYKIPSIDKLKDAKKAAQLIYDSIVNNDLIIDNSDYDADGVSAGGLVEVVCKEYFGVPSDKFISIQNEREFGNGFNQHTLDTILKIHEKTPVGLIITVDHGSVDQDRYIQLPNTTKLVVTDHHLIQASGNPSRADAFVNPQRSDDEFSKYISGATVIYFVLLEVYKLHLINNRPLLKTDSLREVIPIPSNTVITDQMSLRCPINRQLLLQGLEVLNTTSNQPWIELRKRIDIPKKLTETEIGFILGPLLNAPGRMGKASVSQKFVSSTSERTSGLSAMEMIELNQSRKVLQNKILPVAIEQVKMYAKKYKNSIVVVVNDGHGVGGIIAGMVGDKFNKPIFVVSKDTDGNYVGSGRSIRKSIDIEQSIGYMKHKYPEVVTRGGGHKAAGGCTVNKDKLGEFFKIFDESILLQSGTELQVEAIVPDLRVPIDKIGLPLAKVLSELAPYGNGFEKPLLETDTVVVKSFAVGPLKNHLSLQLSLGDGYVPLKAFYPNASKEHINIKSDTKVRIYYNLNIKIARTKEVTDVIIKDIELI